MVFAQIYTSFFILANIASETDFLNQRTDAYNKALDNISTENDLWNRQVQTYNDLVDEINAELKVVAEAVGALNAGGVQRSVPVVADF